MNKVKTLMILSWKNIKSHKWLYAKIAMVFAGLVFMICLFLTYAISLSDTQNEMKNKSASANYFFANKRIEELTDMDCLELKYFDFTTYAGEWFDDESSSFLWAGKVIVESNGNTYASLPNHEWEKIKVYGGADFVTDNDLKELKLRYDIESCIVGCLPQNENEILVSEMFLQWYGISDDVLGQTVTLCTNSDEKHTILESNTISGIIRNEYYSLDGHRSHLLVPTLFLSEDNALFADKDCVDSYYMYSADTWLSIDKIQSIEQNQNCTFAGKYVLDKIVLIENMQEIALNLFVVIGVSLGLGFVLMIILMFDKLLTVFSRDGGILLTCGMNKTELKKLFYVLLLWVCLFAIVLAIVLTITMCAIINKIVGDFYLIEISISFLTIVELFFVGIGCVMLFTTIVYLFISRKINRCTIKELLTTTL